MSQVENYLNKNKEGYVFAPEPTYVPTPPYFSAFRSGPIFAAAPKPKKVFYLILDYISKANLLNICKIMR